MKGSPGHVVAGCVGMSAFTVAIVAGMASESPAQTVLARAVFAMIVCYPIGLIVGMICERLIQSHVEATMNAGAQDESEPAEPDERVQGEPEEISAV